MTVRLVNGIYLADTARVLGEVTLDEGVSVWYGAVVRGDVAPIHIGPGTNVQDRAVVHCDTDQPNVIGAQVSIGHGAIVHGAAVGDGALVGMGATLLGGTRIGSRCIVAAGAVVPPGMEVPDEHVVMGVPGKVVRPITDREREHLVWLAARYQELARLHVEHPDDARVRAYGMPG